jgi:hypothetical protein
MRNVVLNPGLMMQAQYRAKVVTGGFFLGGKPLAVTLLALNWCKLRSQRRPIFLRDEHKNLNLLDCLEDAQGRVIIGWTIF